MWTIYALVPLAIIVFLAIRSGNKHLPPGPKPLFLLGNLFDVPSDAPWKVYAEWGRKYGEC